MVKTALSAVVVLAAFAGALVAGGNVMGAWEPYDPTAAGTPQPGAQPKAAPAAGKRRHAKKPARTHAKPARDARWIRRANALCRAARRESQQSRAPRTAEEIEAFLKQGVKQNRYWNRRFVALGAPRGEAKRFAPVRALLRQDEALLAELVKAVKNSDGASALLLGDRLVNLAQRESALMVALGASECSLPSTAI
jgi:hypothetical protein